MNRPKRGKHLKLGKQTLRVMDAEKLRLVVSGNDMQKTGCSSKSGNISWQGPCDAGDAEL